MVAPVSYEHINSSPIMLIIIISNLKKLEAAQLVEALCYGLIPDVVIGFFN
jgi:hypothetical protein